MIRNACNATRSRDALRARPLDSNRPTCGLHHRSEIHQTTIIPPAHDILPCLSRERGLFQREAILLRHDHPKLDHMHSPQRSTRHTLHLSIRIGHCNFEHKVDYSSHSKTSLCRSLVPLNLPWSQRPHRSTTYLSVVPPIVWNALQSSYESSQLQQTSTHLCSSRIRNSTYMTVISRSICKIKYLMISQNLR